MLNSYKTSLGHFLQKVRNLGNGLSDQIRQFSQVEGRVLCKKRLIVCLHGLNNNPGHFSQIVTDILDKKPVDTDFYIPEILQKGNAPLEEMVKPIFAEIEKWAQTDDAERLVLVGISNGGRLARAVETTVSMHESCSAIKQIQVVSIVGAWNGSSLANLARRLKLHFLVPKNIIQEMPTDSASMQKLNADWKEHVEESNKSARDYTFIASPHDWHVPNYESTLPAISRHKVRYAIVPNHGHNSIVDAASKAVAEIIVDNLSAWKT